MLTKLELHNFKAHTETHIPLERLTVLIGPNASGKSGLVAAKRLSEHPKAHLLDALTTGEFWTAEGEDWVTEP